MHSDKKETEHLLTAKEVASFLKIPLSTLYSLTKQGKLKGIKVGKHWRYTEDDLHRFLEHPEAIKGFAPEHPEEKRNHPRINCELPARISVLLDRRNEFKEGVIYDVGVGGARFVGGGRHEAIQVGDPIQINFDLPGCSIQAQGRVVRQDLDSTVSLGIKFRNMTKEVREAIETYVG